MMFISMLEECVGGRGRGLGGRGEKEKKINALIFACDYLYGPQAARLLLRRKYSNTVS